MNATTSHRINACMPLLPLSFPGLAFVPMFPLWCPEPCLGVDRRCLLRVSRSSDPFADRPRRGLCEWGGRRVRRVGGGVARTQFQFHAKKDCSLGAHARCCGRSLHSSACSAGSDCETKACGRRRKEGRAEKLSRP